MTYEKAIYYLNDYGLTDKRQTASVIVEASTMAVEALEKQIPKKPKIEICDNRIPEERKQTVCPNCGEWIGWDYKSKYCCECGQAIDWGEDE